jgi:hypothetical protein
MFKYFSHVQNETNTLKVLPRASSPARTWAHWFPYLFGLIHARNHYSSVLTVDSLIWEGTMRRFLLTMILLGSICSRASAQEVFLQREGQFLYPPNLTTGGDDVLMGMTLGSVRGYPITGTIDVENTRTDSHGKTVIARFRSKIYRDSKGRTRLEWDMTPLDEPAKPGWFMIEIYDPTTRTSIHLQPSTKTASKGHLPGPNEKPQQVCKASDFPRIHPRDLAQMALPQVSQKELAHDVVDGIAVRHGREAVRLSPNSPGKNSAYARVTDYWFSQELQAFVLVKRSGPGKSQHTVKLSDFNRGEPDPSFFIVPPDYQVSEPEPWDGDCSQKLML